MLEKARDYGFISNFHIQSEVFSSPKDSHIFSEGTLIQPQDPDIFLVTSGLIALQKTSSDGKAAIGFIAKRGNIFGQEDFGQSSRSTTARVLVPTLLLRTRLSCIPEEKKEEFNLLLAQIAARRVKQMTNRVLLNGKFFSLVRVADAILNLSEDGFVHVSRSVIAELAQLSKKDISGRLINFKNKGFIRQENKTTLKILKPDNLQEMVDKALGRKS